jgi:hypothetical protein
MEITEEEEEEERERKRQSIVKEEDRPKSSSAQTGPPIKLDAELAHLPGASQFGNDLEPPQFMGVPRPSSPAKSFDESSRRMSSQSSRTADLYPSTTYPYSKPRVKLGPRPSADPTGRPRSSAGGSAHRVATVPAGLKSMSKGPRKARSHSQSQDDEAQEQAEDTLSLIEVAEADTKPSENGSQPQFDSATDAPVDTMPPHKIDMPAPAPQPTKKNTMTPEKARLLKAMKLREKKLMSLQPTLDVPTTDIPSAPSTPGLPDEKQDTAVAEDVPPVDETPIEGDAQKEEAPATNSDSAIDVGTDHASVDTAMDSHPASPAATSEIGDSTQASSLSDSTDETILAKDEQPINENEQGVAGDDNKLAASAPEEHIGDAESRQHDNRESQATITVPDKGDLPTPPEPQVEQSTVVNAPTSDALPETSSTLAVSEVPAAGVPENDASDVTPTEAPGAPAPTSDLPEETGPVSEEKVPLPQIHIPLSKFSTQETKSPTTAATEAVPSIAAQTSDVDSWRVVESAPPVPEKDDVVGTGDGDVKRRKLPDRIQTNLDAPDNDKRRSVISILDNDGFMDELQSATVQQATPITVSKSPISPFFSLDQPSKRPGGGPDDTSRYVRTVSNPVRNSYLGGEVPSGPVRSASSGAAYLQKPSPSDAKPKNAKLGSSISQRIKALEKLSVNTPGVETVTTPKERPASTFFAVRKTSVREGSRPSSVAGRTNSMTRGVSPSPPASRDSSSPEATRNMGRGRSGSLVNRLSMFEGGMPPRGRPESVQVTARIVRDPNQRFPKGPEPKGSSTEYGNLDLKQSPLLVDVQNRTDSRSPVRPPSVMSNRTLEREIADQAKQTLLERRLSKQSRDGERDTATAETTEGRRPRRRSSLSVVKDFIKDKTESMMGAKSPSTDNGNATSPAPTGLASPSASRPSSRARSVNQPGSLARRLSVSSRRSSIDQNNPNMSVTSLPPPRTADLSAESDAEAKLEKKSGSSGPASPKSNRASRFMRRLSNTLVTGRKTTAPSISPTVAEENAAEVEAASRGSTAVSTTAQVPPSIVAFMGDVNVQFPDNLLWKRRSICLDNQGFLILSAVQGTAMMPTAMSGKDRNGAMVKRYHMSDFKAPYAPDVELQELPNSIVLDLVDGSGLQIACVDRAGQMSILHILGEAHHNHSNF